MEKIAKANQALSALKKEYEKRYGFALFDVGAFETDKGVYLAGSVLVEEQKKEALKLAKEISGGKVKENVTVLGDVRFKPLGGWAVAKERANVWRYLPGSAPAKALEDGGSNLSSQLDTWDHPAKIIHGTKDFHLIMCVDGTIGWVEEAEISRLPFDGSNYWQEVTRAVQGSRTPVINSVRNLIEAALDFVDAPYLWGGTTLEGIDCSGLVQRAYYGGVGLVLPKNSKEQLKTGERILKREVSPGDLIFLTIENTILHVGILLDEGRFIHASRDERMVVVEELDDILKKRRFAGARRLVFFESELPDMESPNGQSEGAEVSLFSREDEF